MAIALSASNSGAAPPDRREGIARAIVQAFVIPAHAPVVPAPLGPHDTHFGESQVWAGEEAAAVWAGGAAAAVWVREDTAAVSVSWLESGGLARAPEA